MSDRGGSSAGPAPATLPFPMKHAAVSPALLAVTLAALSMLGPFSIDTYMPSFPAIQREFGVGTLEMQQTLSAYLLPFAAMTLFHGTLSDSFGRKPVVLVSLAVFTLGSLGCVFSQSFAGLLAFRAVQGLSAGAGMVVGRAIIRDSLEGHAAQRLMATVTMIFGLAPAIAPIIGGWLQKLFGWHSIFVFLTLFGAALWTLCAMRLPETLPVEQRQPFAVKPLARNYWTLGRDRELLLLCSAVAFNFAGFFIYVASAPAVIYGLLRLGEHDFAWLFVPGISGVMFGAFLSGRLAGRLHGRRTVALGYGVMIFAAAFNLFYSGFFDPSLPWTVAPVMIYTIGMSLAMPTITLLALELHPAHRGMTSSLQGFLQSLLTGLVSGLVAPFLALNDFHLAIGMTVLLLIGLASWFGCLRISRPRAAHE